jgi:hypothetical protein
MYAWLMGIGRMEAVVCGTAFRCAKRQLPRRIDCVSHLQRKQTEGKQAHRAERFYDRGPEGASAALARGSDADLYGNGQDQEAGKEGTKGSGKEAAVSFARQVPSNSAAE